MSSGTKNNVLLQTATAIAKNEDGTRYTKVKILFDSKSQRSYVTDNLKSKLDLKSTKTAMLHLRRYVWREDITKTEMRRADFSLEDGDKRMLRFLLLVFLQFAYHLRHE